MIPKTRQEAIAMGVDQYFTGKPCPHGHIANRRISGACCACASVLFRQYRKNNPEKAKAWNLASQKRHRDSANRRNRKYYKAHPEKRAAYARKYYEANREEVIAKKVAWQKANPEKVNATLSRRRAAKLRAIPKWADHDAINRIYERAQAFRVTGQDVHVDHVIPLQGKTVCGLHVHDNLRIIPAFVNRSKSNSLKGE